MNINRLYPNPSSFWNEVDHLFNRALRPSVSTPASGRLLISENEEGWTLRTDLPGYARENVELSVEDGHLRLAATGEDERPGFVPPFTQRIRLSPKIDTTAISARLENGVLEISLPRKVQDGDSEIRIEVN